MFRCLFVSLCTLLLFAPGPLRASVAHAPRFQFLGVTRFDRFASAAGPEAGQQTLTSPVLAPKGDWDQLVVSWNADTPPGGALRVQARAVRDGHNTRWYDMGYWAATGHTPPRTSISDQKDADGIVDTDTLTLKSPVRRVQIRVISDGPAALTFLGLSLMNSKAAVTERATNKRAWGRELAVPVLSQRAYAEGDGWCSPTSLSMALGYWAQKAHRPDWNVGVPQCAAGVFDDAWQGTGNWPFNTAFAGSLSGLRAYVTRLDGVRDLEDWIAHDVPVVLSVSVRLGHGDEPGPSGHLVVCTGFTHTGDLIIHDPWTRLDKGESGRRIYRRSRLAALWRKSNHAVYIIHPTTLHIPQEDSFS